MSSKKGCWTCKDRKVQCDRGLPSCQRCIRARRVCQGYGARLSWPKCTDKKRAVTCNPPVIEAGVRANLKPTFINTSYRDVNLHLHLFSRSAAIPLPLDAPNQILKNEVRSKGKPWDLIQYFHDVAYQSFTTFSSTPALIRDVIIRLMLVEETTPPRQALLYALFAVSSLRRNGLCEEAVAFKVSALRALGKSIHEHSMTVTEVAQHVVTCMLLCAFEIQLPSESSEDWLWYIRAAMDLMQQNLLHHQSDLQDIDVLQDWVYYHNALARFAIHHWRRGSMSTSSSNPQIRKYQNSSLGAIAVPSSRSQNPTHTILNLLCEICDTLVDPQNPKRHDKEYQDRLEFLELEVRNLPISTSSTSPLAHVPCALELYQMTTLMYLVRASENILQRPVNIQSFLDKAFAITHNSSCCHHFFPLFILACEARTDEERRTILDVIERTEGRADMRNMEAFKSGVLSVWVQQDLNADNDLIIDYQSVIDTVVSSNYTLPSFT